MQYLAAVNREIIWTEQHPSNYKLAGTKIRILKFA